MTYPPHTSKKQALQAFGPLVKAVRLAWGWTREELAEKMNTSAIAIWRIETGTHEPGIITVQTLAIALEVPLCMLGSCPYCNRL